MPKIKIKNIPYKTQVRICARNLCNSHCPYYVDEMLVNDDLEHAICIKDSKYDAAEKCIEFSEEDFPTNREWLESCPDSDLAKFYTSGLLIEKYSQYPVNLQQIIGNFVSSEIGIEEWLSQPCRYLMEEE